MVLMVQQVKSHHYTANGGDGRKETAARGSEAVHELPTGSRSFFDTELIH